jgi:hypothetical protein
MGIMGTITATVLIYQNGFADTEETVSAFDIIFWDRQSDSKTEEQLKFEVQVIASICSWVQLPNNPNLN